MRTVIPSSLFERAVCRESLFAAWKRVRGNSGGAGGDGVSLHQFERDLGARLAQLGRSLESGRYRPGPLARHRIPKRSGGWRELAVPPIADRIAQTAVLSALTPRLDARMADESFAYRPGRSVEQALAKARRHIADGMVWIVDADIERFFDRVPHRTLLQELAIWLDDTRLLALIGLWLAAWGRFRRGLPQGAPLSPLLANLYLHPFDRLLKAAGIAAVRYADDFVLLCRSREAARRALGIAAVALRSRGLRLHPEKTRILHVGEGVTFLGQTLGGAGRAAAPPGSRTAPVNPQSVETASAPRGLLQRTLRLFLRPPSGRPGKHERKRRPRRGRRFLEP